MTSTSGSMTILLSPGVPEFYVTADSWHKRMTTHPVIGSITTLYNGLLALDNIRVRAMNFYAEEMDPISSIGAECLKLKPNRDCMDLRKKGKKIRKGKRSRNVTESKSQGFDDRVLTVNTVSFVIFDDLQIEPVVPGSFLPMLIKLGITDTDGADLRNLTLGFNEIMDLLRGSLHSKTPLTDLVFPEMCKLERVISGSLPLNVDKRSSYNSKKITVKAMKGSYLVTDDLTVMPFGMASGFSILSGLKVPLSDVKEMKLEMGFEEALSIVRASLTSSSALTNGLMQLYQ
ncbi:hypothetical protein PHJA_000099500 [Phtheirospermum japonicum]|uniref:Uncharacterized protein n=1 Tax=Phtheirospermum japonicum TaxID=374723 RepID=A0A830AXU8_9LAMI|nr:hypothetical protein PHJA_000099500 [Phtheirospermum japonicum]